MSVRCDCDNPTLGNRGYCGNCNGTLPKSNPKYKKRLRELIGRDLSGYTLETVYIPLCRSGNNVQFSPVVYGDYLLVASCDKSVIERVLTSFDKDDMTESVVGLVAPDGKEFYMLDAGSVEGRPIQPLLTEESYTALIAKDDRPFRLGMRLTEKLATQL